MIISRVRVLALAAAASIAAVSGAHSADLPLAPPPVPEFSGWYLRGDIGFSNQNVRSLFNANYAGFTSVNNIDKGFDAAPLFGLGVGYTVNNWLRFDVTGEYRGAANFHGLDVGALPACSGVAPCFADDRYTASKSEWTFLFNGYVDLGTWWSITPFIGAGVGASRNTISNFGDFSACIDSSNCGLGGSDAFGGTFSKWNFAWALHAGIAYQAWRNVTLELAYRYIDLGNAQSGDLVAFNGTNNFYNPMEFHHLTSQDVKLGVRFNLGGYDYQPPPPPLRSKG
ncbi:MAG TPA: outer membrane beta-barrel protein [Pseudolabrys sp.]|jgi:opacity protein-like surface antigen|nr:outer membrane beta-barrel protein [Pseudolabrys sp.]